MRRTICCIYIYDELQYVVIVEKEMAKAAEKSRDFGIFQYVEAEIQNCCER